MLSCHDVACDDGSELINGYDLFKTVCLFALSLGMFLDCSVLLYVQQG